MLVDVYSAINKDLTLIGNDDVHPTDRGVAVIANTFTDAIRANFEEARTTKAEWPDR